MSPDFLVKAMRCTRERAARFAPHLAQVCSVYAINTPERLAAFLAQLGHESGALRYVREVWGPTPAQQRYEGRADLGNTQPGDGKRFMGRGLIQLTGRANYAAFRDRMRARGIECPDFEAEPERVEEPRWAAMSAGDFWNSRNLNALADAGQFERITRKINGGLNGQADRLARWETAKQALKGNDMPPFIAAALPAVLNAAPALIEMFKGDSKSAERNAEAAKVVVEIAKGAVGARNEQELVEVLETQPEAAAQVREAIEANWFDIQKAAEQSVREARDHAMRYSQMKDVRTVVGNFTFIEFLTLVFLLSCWTAIGVLATFSKISEGTLDNIIMLAVVASIVGIREYWYGSSFGSRQKDENKTP